MAEPGTVLIVEDDLSLRETYAEVLRDEGWQVRTASDGVEALAMLEDGFQPCVAIVDLRMPRMDGWELARRLRDRGLETVPFVILAAHHRVQDEAHRIGARWWLQKPVMIDRLLETVSAACRSGGTAA